MKTRLLLSLFPLVAACTTPMHKASRVVTFEVPAAALQRLGCTSHNGSIRVTGDAKAAVVTVRAELSVRGFTPEEAAANLAQLDVAQEVAGDALTLGGRCPDALRRRFSPAFDFTITAPARLAVSATSHNGGIRAEGVDGEIEATTHNGDLHVTGGSPSVQGLTHNGDVVWRGAARRLALTTNNGDIDAEFGADGEVTAELTTHNGDVDLAFAGAVDAGFAAETHNGRLRLGSRVTPVDVGKRKATGRVGKGGAGAVRATTHNGSVTVK
jgi:hypothetical protein